MTTERWRQIEDLFHSALERAPAERAAFLNNACGGDAEMREQVEKLLRSFDESGDFIERPLLADSLPSAAEPFPAESLIGQTIGHYEILRPLGAGGMGEVYLARDARLDREIALKLLPAQFTQDAAQVRRFEREARAASALNHPNIITIYEIGQDGDWHFIATEFIAGRTLRELIASGQNSPNKKMEARDALGIVGQIASALAAAHAAGIVHRDIKPENVMVRPDGLVKVLDFGLAKPLTTERDTGGLTAWKAVSLQTDPRMLMGTLAYLSPEQARGERVDHRTDLFSLGVVLYEMIAGARPFKGDGMEAVLDAVLNRKPDPVPGKLHCVIERALEKDPAERYQTAVEMRDDLQRLADGRAFDPAPRAGRTRKAALVALAGGAIVALAAGWFLGSRPATQTMDARSPWIDAASVKLTGHPGMEIFPSLAPDGQSFVYARHVRNQYDIFFQRAGEIAPLNLTADSEAPDLMPAFSPDGARIAFRSDRDGGGIFVMDADGRNVRRLAADGFNPAWSPDGREIAYATRPANSPHSRASTGSQVWAVNVATSQQRHVDTGTGSDAVHPAWSPNGERIAYWGLRGTHRDIWTAPSRGGEPVAVTRDDATDWNPVWSPGGDHLYFASDIKGSMRFWRVRIDQSTGRVLGEREAVTGAAAESWHPSFSRDGKRLAYVAYNVKENLQRIDFDPGREVVTGPLVAVPQGELRVTAPELSPDGESLAYYSFGSPREDLFVVKTDGTAPRRLTDDRPRDRVPRWSPDGKRLAFYSDRGGNYDIWTIGVDGGGLRRITECGGANCFYPTWSPDGKRLAVYKADDNTLLIEPDKAWSQQTPQPLPPMPSGTFGEGAYFAVWSWSPDGERLAGIWYQKGGRSSGICLYSLATGQYERLTEQGTDPIWLNDNRRLLFIRNARLCLVDSRTRTTREVLSPDPLRITLATISRDNRHLYFSVISPETDIHMLLLN